MKLLYSHTWCLIVDLLRQPAYVVSSITFPALFYSIFALPESNDVASSNYLMASFSAFAVFGVCFLQFGVGISQERSHSWHYFLRTLPIRPHVLILARFISVLVFSLLTTLAIVVLALIYTPAHLSFINWVQFIFALLTCGFVFCLMGLALGYWTSEKSSLPIGNLIYLPMSFAGGLWKPPNLLSDMLTDISKYLPTRAYGEVLWAVVGNTTIETRQIKILAIYAFIFLAIAWLGFKRDTHKRFS